MNNSTVFTLSVILMMTGFTLRIVKSNTRALALTLFILGIILFTLSLDKNWKIPQNHITFAPGGFKQAPPQ